MAQKIIALRKNDVGDLVEVKLESGEVVSYVRAKQMAKNGEIEFVNVFEGKEGEKGSNLDDLPTF